MAEKLGNIVSVHGIAPATLQRTVIVAALSFLFFLVTMVMFSMWKNFLYFFMSTAFLIVYALTMFGWLRLRKNTLTIYENGMKFRKFSAVWSEIEAVRKTDDATYEISKAGGEKIVLSDSFYEIEKAIGVIEAKRAGYV